MALRGECPIRPLPGKLVVERTDPKKIGRILIPETAHEKTAARLGRVLAVGPAKLTFTFDELAGASRRGDAPDPAFPIHPGDVVAFLGFAGSEIQVAGKTYVVLARTEVLAVIDDPGS